MAKIVSKGVIFLLLLLLIGFIAFRRWQGPVVMVYSLTQRPLLQTVVATGQVATASSTTIGSEVSGVVLERLVAEGEQVKRGDVLLRLKSDAVAAQVHQAQTALEQLAQSTRPQAVIDLANAKIQLEQASREWERRQHLAKQAAISKEEMEQAQQDRQIAQNRVETARLKVADFAEGGLEERRLRERLAELNAQMAKTVMRSEVDGTVLTCDAEVGDMVQSGQTLFTFANKGSTEIRVLLDERNLSRLALRQKALAIADAYPQTPFSARVAFIAPNIDSARGTVEVRLVVDSPPNFLRQDMTVSVNIETGRREQALVIPNDAFTQVQGDAALVWVVRENKIARQKIRLGLRGLAMSEVLSGLQEGEYVLTDANMALTDGSKVRFQEQEIPFMAYQDDTLNDNVIEVLETELTEEESSSVVSN